MRISWIAAAALAWAGFASAQDSSAPAPQWHYGAFADGAYLYDFNSPANHLFKDRGTGFYVDDPVLNMAAVWLKKDASEKSRWGMEFTLQAGKDAEIFGFSSVEPDLAGSKWLRHLGPTDVSYLAPVGKGLTIQGGIFSSLIGYDSLYRKDNFTYTMPWGADYTPYLMMGVNASYPFTPKLTGTAFVITDYFHLANPNSVPSEGGQLAYKATDRTTMKETVLYGPHQSNTSPGFWRFFSDSIAEWKTDRVTTAFEYQIGEEKLAPQTHFAFIQPRALWMSSQLPLHWSPRGPIALTVRPEFTWDRNGRWTGDPQFIKAITTTFQYRIPYRAATAIIRLEHRYDNSHGQGGGFFNDGYLPSGVPGLKASQHLFVAGLILTIEGSHK